MLDSWRKGPIAFTGADGQVGRALRLRLSRLPNEVRAVGPAADPTRAYEDAAVVVHLAGSLQPRRPNTYRRANLETVLATVGALEGSTAERVVFLSFLTADVHSRNRYLRYKAEAEIALGETGIPTVILRCGHIIGSPGDPGPTAGALLSRRGRVTVLGDGRQLLTPIARHDVVAAIVRAALDPRSPTGTFELAGPQTMTLLELVRLLNGEDVEVRRLPSWTARLLGAVTPGLPLPLVDLMLADAVPRIDVTTTAAAFSVDLTPLSAIWPARVPSVPRSG
jgi:uncharacterized protein YbjT (DUF2867 family)